MPVSIQHTHVITAIVMTWSGSIIEAIFHVLVVPRLIVTTVVAIGMM